MRRRASSADGSLYRVPDTLFKITSNGVMSARVVMVYEPMPCVRVDPDVVVHAQRGQGPFQPGGGAGAHRGPVLAAVAAGHRASAGAGPAQRHQGSHRSWYWRPHTRARPPARARIPAHAEPDHPDPAGAVMPGRQLVTHRIDVSHGPPPAGGDLTHDRPQAAQCSSRNSARSESRWLLTDTYWPEAMASAPASSQSRGQDRSG